MALPSQLLVKNIQLEDGKMIPAAHFFEKVESSALELTEEELGTAEAVRVRSRWGCCGGGVHALGVCSGGRGACTPRVRMSWPQARRGSVLRVSPGPPSSAGSYRSTA